MSPRNISRNIDPYLRAIHIFPTTELALQDHVDGIYRMLELRQELPADPPTIEGHGKHTRRDSHSHHTSVPHPHRPDVHHLIDGLRHLELNRNRKAPHILLYPLIAEWSPPLEFLPEDEAESIPIAKVPDELLLYVLQFLDVWTLERFALVNRKARIVTLDSGLWRFVAMSVSL
ncbi:hypothetical protein QCA50_009067 [Cerrena zonata]|uniref:F-box domain-containing protein n=1 Tax=Cerrena zonata TaxID=2478898 RepID=A0AAW0G296_9APHY